MKLNNKRHLFAAIDIGSQSLSMKIAEIRNNSEVIILENVKRSVFLGRDAFAMGKISYETLKETCEVLKGFKKLMTEYDIKIYTAVATSAVREATNRDYVIDQIKLKTGLNIEIIGNSEERFYTYKAIKDSMDDYNQIRKEGCIIADIGSGSIQVSIYTNGELSLSQNIKLGSLRVKEILSSIEGRTLNFHKVLEEFVASNIDSINLFQQKEIYSNLIVIGSEIKLIKDMLLQSSQKYQNKYISKSDFLNKYNELLYLSPQEITKNYNVQKQSSEILLPTMMIINKFLDITSADKIHTPMVTLVDGVISDMAFKKFNPYAKDEFENDIVSLSKLIAKKYYYNSCHSSFVEKNSLILFDELKKLHGLVQRERFLLQLAAILHDTGKYININKHYIHSYNIIMASDLLGISVEEMKIVANVARYHSTVVPSYAHENYISMSERNRIVASKLVAIIRIADSLDRSHRQKINEISVSIQEDEVVIRAESKSDTILEQWTFEKKAEFFKEVFGVYPILKISRKV